MKTATRYFLLAGINLTLVQKTITTAQVHATGMEVQLPAQTKLVNIAGKPTVYYELYITNLSTDTVVLKSLTVNNARTAAIYCSAAGNQLKSIYKIRDSSGNTQSENLLPGIAAVMFLEYSLPKKTTTVVTHTIVYITPSTAKEVAIKTSELKLDSKNNIVVGAPLKGGPWAAVYEPAWVRGHRRVIYTENGTAKIPGRYAIDFIKLDSNGRYAKASEDSVANWFGYGEKVLAVSDGVVASVADSFLESITISKHGTVPPYKATGNYVSLKIRTNCFVFYEHLKPGSIVVKPGQKVKKGQVIAQLGFTGQSTGPHLHLHMADADSPLGAEGLPFEFELFETIGTYTNFALFGKEKWVPANSPLKGYRRGRPSPNSVITFKK